jgi:hypothetical protein
MTVSLSLIGYYSSILLSAEGKNVEKLFKTKKKFCDRCLNTEGLLLIIMMREDFAMDLTIVLVGWIQYSQLYSNYKRYMKSLFMDRLLFNCSYKGLRAALGVTLLCGGSILCFVYFKPLKLFFVSLA